MKKIAITMALLVPLSAQAGTGLFVGLPAVGQAPLAEWEAKAAPAFANAGCSLRRSGRFSGSLGPLEWPDLDQFRLFECNGSVLPDLQALGTEQMLSRRSSQPVLIEGELNLTNAPEPPRAAEYILKVSHYKETDSTARDKHLKELNASVSGLTGVWNTEGALMPSIASGAIRPDELTIIYYESPESAEVFRDTHPEALESVGRFNNAHVTSFTYLGAALDGN